MRQAVDNLRFDCQPLWGTGLQAGRHPPPPAVGKPWEDSEPLPKMITLPLGVLGCADDTGDLQ
jgi:hypothetical protein